MDVVYSEKHHGNHNGSSTVNYIANREKINPFIDKLKNKEPVTIVTLGDSNTGNFWFTNGGKQWPEHIQTELRKLYDYQYVMLFNAGICGDTAADGLRRLDRDVIRFKPDLTIVAFASNDAKKRHKDEFSKDMTAICQRLSKAGSLVVLRTVPPVLELKPNPPHIWKGDKELRLLNQNVATLAQQLHLPFVDIYGLWESLEKEGQLSMSKLMHDEVHTNAEGHALIANQMLELFKIVS